MKRLFGNETLPRPTVDEDAGYVNPDLMKQQQAAQQAAARAICKILSIDLNVARTDVAFEYSGNLVKVLDSGAGTDIVKLRFCSTDGDLKNDPYLMHPGDAIRFPFSRLLISNTQTPAPAGGTNTMTLAIFTDPGSNGQLIGFE